MTLYSCPCCGESVAIDVLGRMAPHPSRITPGYDCPASRHRPKVMEQFVHAELAGDPNA